MDQFDTTAEPKKTLNNRAMTAGLYIAAASIVLGLVEYVVGLSKIMMTNTPLSLLNSLISFGIVFYFIHTALRLYRDQDNGGYLTVGNGMALGSLAGLIAGIISAVWTVIFMMYIAPDLIEMSKNVQLQKLQESGQSEEQIEKIMEMSAMFFSPIFVGIMVALFNVIFGFICGLVSGLIQRRERPYA